MANILTFFLIANIMLITNGSRILMLPGPHKSHIHFFAITARDLHGAGHVVDLLTMENRKSLVEKSHISPLLFKSRKPNKLIDDPNAFENMVMKHGENVLAIFHKMTMAAGELCDSLFENDEMLNILENNHYDLVLVDGIDYNRCFYALPYRLGIKYITLTVKHDPWNVGLPAIPSVEHLPLIGNIITEDSSFFDRLKSLFMYVYVYTHFPSSVLDDADISRHAPGKPKTTYSSLFKNSEMWLVKLEMMCLDWPRVYGSHYQFIGGIGLEPAHPLPDDLEKFVMEAKDGVIVQTFGTALLNIPPEMLSKMLMAYSQMNYHVIMRHSGFVPDSVPPNVMMMSWLPQSDLLGHPRTKAFVTHGGTNGQTEAIHHGVPMIVIPLFGDQFHNAERVTRKGLGVTLDRHTFTQEELIYAIKRATSNDIRNTMNHCSEIFHSAPPANETLHYWVEHIIRFGGDHLKPVSIKVPAWKFLMLDFFGILILLILCAYTLILYVLCKAYKKLCNTKDIQSAKKVQ